jgi:uncharacterized protein YndB with AHSA1/START domain
MWAHEHTVETAVAPEAIWKVLADLNTWPAWDTSMEAVTLNGPLAVGSTVTMIPTGQDPITSVITEVAENERYADQTVFGGATLAFSHTLTRLADGGTRITHRLKITGERAAELGPELGPMITEDFPDAMVGLLAYAAA